MSITNRDKINWLKKYRLIDLEISRKLEERDLWRARAEKITPSLTGMPQGGGEDQIQSAVEHIWELDQEIDQKTDALIDLRRKIEEAIQSIPDETERLVIEYKYIDNKRWEQIAIDLHYTYRHITRMHGRAIQKIEVPKDVLECPTHPVI